MAFKNPDGSVALIVLNAHSASRTFKVRVGQASLLYTLPASSVATFTWSEETPPNRMPTVALTAPTSGRGYTAPATITLSATAADIDGHVALVNFYAGPSLIGSSKHAALHDDVARGPRRFLRRDRDRHTTKIVSRCTKVALRAKGGLVLSVVRAGTALASGICC